MLNGVFEAKQKALVLYSTVRGLAIRPTMPLITAELLSGHTLAEIAYASHKSSSVQSFRISHHEDWGVLRGLIGAWHSDGESRRRVTAQASPVAPARSNIPPQQTGDPPDRSAEQQLPGGKLRQKSLWTRE